ncbi:hypothetical protein ACROYT_G005826 [Oculina patagonica]
MNALLLVVFITPCVLAHSPLREPVGSPPLADYVPLIQHNSTVNPKSEQKSTKVPKFKREDVSVLRHVSGSKRGVVAAAVADPKVQEAVVEKGIEVAGKLVDKQLQIIDDAQQKAADFLKKEIKLDISPDKGWQNEDMFVPPGYHIDASIEGGEKSPKEVGEVPYVFPAGLGTALMNGCWGTDYKETDPCYSAKWKSSVCQDMIDGAAFMGVGFDGRGKYSPESRKMSIVQRNCANKATYDGLDVPDTMNVHGIYDTSASLMTFESREEYKKMLQQEAGVSGSYFGFSAGVKEAWGESTASSRQKYMAVMDIDVDRYEIFMDEVKPQDLSMSFLREFMSLPTSYFSAGGPLKYQNFLQRWGTHFIKSAKFGGQLEIRKTMDAQEAKSKKEFEVQMEMEYKTLFASVGAKASAEENESSRKQSKTTSTSVVAHGGSQDIASILSDVYSPTFKTEFKEWLKTIPTYPKAFQFQMGSITDLLDFRANDLFQEETVSWGCEGNAAHLQTEEKEGKILKYYEVTDTNGSTTRHYCEYDSRQALEDALQLRRTSLQRAIEIYMEEGAMSISDIELNKCTPGKDQPFKDKPQGTFWRSKDIPSWARIIKHSKVFKVSFDMFNDLPNAHREGLNIERDMNRLVRYYKRKWYTSDHDGSFHLYSGFDNGNSDNTSQRKISILGLVLTFREADGSLVLAESDFKASKKYFPTLSEELVGTELARVDIPSKESDKTTTRRTDPPAEPTSAQPCQVKWSNALRFDPTDTNGKCLHFTASTAGTIYVVFAALPKDIDTRYYVQISPEKAAIYKGTTLKTSTTNSNARALGDASLYQSYFVCITESEISTLIEYGKSLGTSDSGDIYLNMIDIQDHINARFYAFGNDANPAKVMDAHLVSRHLTKAECKGDTVRDMETNLCVQECHKDCDPLAGCSSSTKSPELSDGCNACRVALDVENNKCIPECPEHKTLTKDKKCVPTFDAKDTIYVDDFPSLPEFTMCLWIKLDARWQGGYPIALYYNHKKTQVIYILSQKQAEIFFTFQATPNTEQGSEHQRMTLNQLRDYQWHQICTTWSGFNGVVRVYLDGKGILSDRNPTRGEIRGGGRIGFGTSSFLFSEFNVWDRVLSEQDIANNVKKCDGGKGNAFQWHQAFEYVKNNQLTYNSPSVCEAPSENTDQGSLNESEPPPDNEGSG